MNFMKLGNNIITMSHFPNRSCHHNSNEQFQLTFVSLFSRLRKQLTIHSAKLQKISKLRKTTKHN